MSTRALFETLLQGNRDAVELCMIVFDWANTYDHLVDDQVPAAERERALHHAMWRCTVDMNLNPFWRQHSGELAITFANAITSWKVSTALQRRADTHSHIVAHVLRWAPIEFFVHCARIIAGQKWADAAAPAFWLGMTQAHPLEQFLPECGGQQ